MSRTRTRFRSTATATATATADLGSGQGAALRVLACALAAGTVCAGLSAVPASAAETPPVVSRGVTIPEFYTPRPSCPPPTVR